MDYTNHKLPVAATGLAALSLFGQITLAIGILLLLAIIAFLVRTFWRKGK